ncbi:MAG TPA: HAD-IA family hydrolase [Trebonia sp.]|jgi:putative hydrolase of the HAD superfamily|nr:HAD-IA family hydrolase [Trebonia sp.]
MARIRACLVDVYETLVAYDFVAHSRALAELAGASHGAWRRAHVEVVKDFDRGALSVAQAITRVLGACDVHPDAELVARLARADSEYMTARCGLYDDAVPFLRELRARGIKIALVSNCSANTRPLLTALGLIELADETILSCEVGHAKPDPEIYLRALGALGVAAEEAAFVDDQPAYCAGAAAVGVRPIQLARQLAPGDGPPGDGHPGFPVASSLPAAAALL